MTDTSKPGTRPMAVLYLCLCVAAACFAQPLPAREGHLQALDWLTHGTWTAESKIADGHTLRIQNELRWAETGTAIYFLTRFNDEAHYYGIYLYDPAAKQIRFFYSSNDGTMIEGHAAPDGDMLKQDFQFSNAQGTTHYTSLIKRAGEDAYDLTVYQQGSDKPIVAVHYVRKSA